MSLITRTVVQQAPAAVAHAPARSALGRTFEAIPAGLRAPLGVALMGVALFAVSDRPSVNALQIGSFVGVAGSLPMAGALFLLGATHERMPIAERIAPAISLAKWTVPLALASIVVGNTRPSTVGGAGGAAGAGTKATHP